MRVVFASLLFVFCLRLSATGGLLLLNENGNYCHPTQLSIARTRFELNLGQIEIATDDAGARAILPEFDRITIGQISGPQETVLPVYTLLLAVPPDSRLETSIEEDEFVDVPGNILAAATAEDLEWVNSNIERQGFYPADLVTFEKVGQLRDLVLARLTIYPVQYDLQTQTLRVHHKLMIKAVHDGDGLLLDSESLSEAFLPIYRSLLFNASLLSAYSVGRGEYWVLSHGNFVSGAMQLANWKKAKGYPVRVISLSDIGSNPSSSQIRTYLLNLYNNAAVKPDYICLVGDVDMSGGYGLATYTYTNPYGFGTIDSDNFYTFLRGSDYFPEVLIGRISIDYANELTQYLAKHAGYERFPPMGDLDFYRRATVISGGENNYFFTPRLTKLWCREMMLNHGFSAVDTIFASDYYEPPPSAITNSLSRGVAFVNYRGYGTPDGWTSPYYTSSYLNQITNAPYFGVMHSIVCGTGDYNDVVSSCFGETWIRMNNKGGPGFIGNTNHDAHTKWTNAIDHGIYWGLFMAGATTLAQSQLAGKMNLFLSFPENTAPGGQVELYFNSYNVLGDPELNCWIAPPSSIAVSHPESVGIGSAGIEVVVNDINGAPIESAYVCLWKDTEIHLLKSTDSRGKAVFAVSTAGSGQIAVTVAGKGLKPYEGVIHISERPVYCNVSSYSIDDDSIGGTYGDGNGSANPGELAGVVPVVRNFGSSTNATGVAGVISSVSPYIQIISDSVWFGAVAPGDSVIAAEPFLIRIGRDTPDGYPLPLQVTITAEGGYSWTGYLEIAVAAPSIVINSFQIIGGNENGLLDPGESVYLKMELANIGHRPMRESRGVLRCSDSLITVQDSVGTFGAIDTNAIGNNDTDPFIISLDNGAYNGRVINFTLNLIGSDSLTQTCHEAISVGNLASTDPIGPDGYGYYCFDNTDVGYLYHPVYEWVPIDTTGSYVSLYDDRVATINLPFPVKYYGQTYTRVTICDNGFIAMGSSWWPAFLNAHIPGPQCAPAMIAPFWDDLSSGTSQPLKVYYRYDMTNGRMIIGWNRAYNNDTYQRITFEIIILDESVWPTLTGDNEIIIQYNTIPGANLNSVGICNQDRTIGIGYVFNNRYAAGAAVLTNQRALKFTTGSSYITSIDDDVNRPGIFEMSRNYPNPFNQSTVINFELPQAGLVKLDIYDLLGRRVRTLAEGLLDAGKHSAVWDGRNESGQPAAGGIYFYRITAAGKESIRKMVLLR